MTLLLGLYKNRVVDGDVVFYFGEFEGEVHVLDDVDGERLFYAVNFAIVLVFNGLGHLTRSVPLFGAQQKPRGSIEIV